jgi:hypothetical protein
MVISTKRVIYIDIVEPYQELFYKFTDMKNFKSTGFFEMKWQGKTMPNNMVSLECPPNGKYELYCDRVNKIIEFKYLDSTSKERGPYIVDFNRKEQMDR